MHTTGRTSYARHSIARVAHSLSRQSGFRVMGVRETAWFYLVALMTVALVLWTPLPAAPLERAVLPVATPEHPQVVVGGVQAGRRCNAGPTEEDKLVGTESPVATDCQTARQIDVSPDDCGRLGQIMAEPRIGMPRGPVILIPRGNGRP